jgi:hypothetical protein
VDTTDALLKQLNAEIRGLATVDFRKQPAYKLDCLGHKVFLCRPQQILHRLKDLESTLTRNLELAEDRLSLSWTMAKFFSEFLEIQPFKDGNQRTALKFLESQLNGQETPQTLGLQFRPDDLLKKIPLEGDPSKDLPRLARIFARWLQPVQ